MFEMTFWTLVSWLFFLIFSTIGNSNHLIGNKEEGIGYLVRYGYLSAKWVNRTNGGSRMPAIARSANGGRNSLDPVKAAVLTFQRMANLPVTGLLDNATLDAMNWPRCGVTDTDFRNATQQAERHRRSANSTLAPFANYVLFGTKWLTTNITYTITRYTKDMDHDTIDSLISETLNKWAGVSKLRFIRATKQPLMEIKWATGDHGDGEQFDGPGGILAHSFFPPRREPLGHGLPGDVHFDDDDAWNTKPSPGRISLAHVSLHETGHAIGLDHTTDRSAVMYPFFTQSAMNRAAVLTEDDIDGIQQLYGPPDSLVSGATATFNNHLVPVLPTTTTQPLETTSFRQSIPSNRCPFVPGRRRGLSAITQAADHDDSAFAIIGNSIYRLKDEGSIYPGFPQQLDHVLDKSPSAPVTSLVTYVHSGSSFDRRYMYLFKGEDYWRYEIRKSVAALDDANLKMLQGPSLLQMLVQQFLLGQQQRRTRSVDDNDESSPPSRNLRNSGMKIQFLLNDGYPQKVINGFKGINAPGAVVFQLVTDELVYFVTMSEFWTFSPLQRGNSTAAPLAQHPVLRGLPVRPPLLQTAMLYNGRNYFFASNGSYWVWSPSRINPTASDPTPSVDPHDPGRWSMALSISEWWFGCEV